jgi:hypothetical protein
MSKEQLTEQQADVGTATAETAAVDQTQGLPPHVYAQVAALGPADAAALADLLVLYPGFTQRILSVAAPQVGNAAVQRGISIAQAKQNARGTPGAMNNREMHEMLDESPGATAAPTAAPKAQGKPGTLSNAEMHELLDDPAPQSRAQGKPGTLSNTEMHEILDDPAPQSKVQGKPGTLSNAEMHEILDDPAEAKAAEPAWATAARKYNIAHGDLVADFNALTQQSCIGADGRLDPALVAAWQAKHGLAADGKIGPHTVAAARAADVAKDAE